MIAANARGRRANICSSNNYTYAENVTKSEPMKVSKMLGHESMETTQIYLDISQEDLFEAHKKYVF